MNYETGTMTTSVTVQAGDRTLYASASQFTDEDAAVYCKNKEFSGGEVFR